MLHFKPILDTPSKNCKRDPSSWWGCASKTWSFSSVCKKFGGAAFFWSQNMVFPKRCFRWVRFDSQISMVTGPKTFRQAWEESR